MALSLDSSATLLFNGTPGTITLSTSNSNDIIIVAAFLNGGPITSVTSANLTFTLRVRILDSAGGDQYVEEWYAVASSPLSSEVITINGTVNGSYLEAVAFAISGANTSTIWDSNVSVPASNSTSTLLTVSTTNANDFIYAIYGYISSGSPGSGWTQIGTGTYLFVEYQIVSSTQSSLQGTVTGGTSRGGMMDAVIQAGAAPSEPLFIIQRKLDGLTTGGQFFANPV